MAGPFLCAHANCFGTVGNLRVKESTKLQTLTQKTVTIDAPLQLRPVLH